LVRGACEARSRIAAACDAALAAEPSTATATPRWRNEAACSAISAISGEITTVTPCETSAGSWKHVVVSSPGEGEDDDSATARCCGAGAGPSQASQRARVAAFSSVQRAHVHGAVSATLTTFRFFGITAGLFPLNTAFHGEARFAMFVFEIKLIACLCSQGRVIFNSPRFRQRRATETNTPAASTNAR